MEHFPNDRQKQFFSVNCEALRQVNPTLAQRVGQIHPDHRYQWLITESGTPTLTIQMQNQMLHLHSSSDPAQEAQLAIDSLTWKRPQTAAFMGIGLGYTIEQLWLQHNPLITAGLLIEQDIQIFYYFLHRRDWQPWLRHPNIRFVVAPTTDDVIAAAQSLLPQIMGSGLQLLEHPVSMQLYGKFYDAIINNLRRFLQQASAESEFLVRYGPLIQRNAIMNLLPIMQSQGLNQFQNCFANEPAVLIAAGPSLNKNITQLKNYQKQARIFCADTAYRVALQQGLQPDFVAATDPTELNQKHFDGLAPQPEVCLLYESDVFPTIPRQWQGPRIFINSSKAAINRWLEETLGPLGVFEQSLSVAHALYTAATWMGCNPILLIGFDLAYSPDARTTHAAGTTLNRQHETPQAGAQHLNIQGAAFHPSSTQEQIVWVQGISGNLVATSKTMSVFLTHLSHAIQQGTSTVYDATEGGALIPGTTPTTLTKVLQSLPQQALPDDWKYHLKGSSEQSKKPFPKALQKLNHEFRQSVQTAHWAYAETQRIFPQSATIPGQQLILNTEAWQPVEQAFWTIYRNASVQTVLGQALFSPMFLFIRREPDETERQRVEKYLRYFQAVMEYEKVFLPLLEQVWKETSK